MYSLVESDTGEEGFMIIILIDFAGLRLAPELAPELVPELVALSFKDGGPTLRPDLGHREQLHSASVLVEVVVGFAIDGPTLSDDPCGG
jgi:hypothetical protein